MKRAAGIRHFALIPAKNVSRRCLNKNWRNFIASKSLVDFTLGTIPDGIFSKVIVSTDKADYRPPEGIFLHRRDKKLAGKNSCVTDLIDLIIRTYLFQDNDYLWLLNPTSPFRSEDDYFRIKDIIESERPPGLVSAFRIISYIWKNGAPLFCTRGRRRNTEDFKDMYAVENGMFYVMKAGYFREKRSWYGRSTKLYCQDKIWAAMDIDTEDDFIQAQSVGRLWSKGKGAKDA
jgi:CMP-N-acetylneuraminic acid synthetase